MADSNELRVLSKEQIQKLSEELLAVVNARIEERIVGAINDDSDEKHTPSAEAVNTAIKNLSHIVALTVASGNPADANITPTDKTLYVVRKTATAKIGTPYVYISGTGYVDVGGDVVSTGPDVQVITDTDIISAVAAANTATAPTL